MTDPQPTPHASPDGGFHFGDPCPHGIHHAKEWGDIVTVCRVCHDDVIRWHNGTFIHPCDAAHAEGEALAAYRDSIVARLVRWGESCDVSVTDGDIEWDDLIESIRRGEPANHDAEEAP